MAMLLPPEGSPDRSAVLLTTSSGDTVEVRLPTRVRGGESCVYEARLGSGSSRAQARVAVKVALHPEPEGSWLFDEGDLLAQVHGLPGSPVAVVEVVDRGHWNGRPYLVLEWCEDTVERWVAGGPAPSALLAMAAAIAELVAGLHRLEPPIVHRDLKPSNVLLREGSPRLADFGAARCIRLGGSTTTLALFTKGYAPPEQMLSVRHRPSAAQDNYALAATVFFVLTGRPPADERALLARFDGDELVAQLRRMMAASPEARGGTAAELAAILRRTRPGPRRRVNLALPLVAGLVASLGVHAARLDAEVPSYPAVEIPAGAYRVGGSADPRTVQLRAPLRVGRTEVDQGLWEALGGSPVGLRRTFGSGALGRDCGDYYGLPLVGEDLPVVCLDFLDAVGFANALSRADGLRPAYTVLESAERPVPAVQWHRSADGWRLPTHDEWEILARAGRAEPPSPEEACRLANLGSAELLGSFPTYEGGAPCTDGYAGPGPVGAYPPNAWGVSGALGNVYEWVWDTHTGDIADIRGGCFTTVAATDVLTWRGQLPRVNRRPDVGFRLVRTPR